MPDPASAWETYGRSLHRASTATKSLIGERMRRIGVHIGQNFLIEELAREDGLTPGELARRIGVEVPSVTRAAQRMEASGLVERVPDRHDRRLVRITLTERGRGLVGEMTRILEEASEQSLAGLTPAERAELIRLLDRVTTNLTHF